MKSPQLQEIRDEFDRADAWLDALVDTYPSEAWREPPEPGAWSALECIEHLNISARKYLDPLESAIEQLKGGVSHQRSYTLGLFGRLFRTLVGPLPRFGGRRRGGVSTSEDFTPSLPDLDVEAVIEESRGLRSRLVELLEAGDGLALDSKYAKFASPFDERVKVTPFLAFAVLARHEHRHLQQAEEALAS